MRASMRVVLTGAVLLLGATSARADESYYGTQSRPPQYRVADPGASAGAAFYNIVFTPIRVAFTVVGAGLGGATGFLTAGNVDAAEDVWGLFDGQQYAQPSVMNGQEPLHFGQFETTYYLAPRR